MRINEPWDWELDESHDLIVPIRYVTGLKAVAQAVRIAVRMVKGEYFADLDAGLDWYGVVLGQRYNEEAIRSEFRRVILAVDGVKEIISLVISADTAARTLTVAWRATAEFEEADELGFSDSTTFPLQVAA